MRRALRALAIVAGALGLVAARACVWVLDSDAGNRVTVRIAPTSWPAPADATGRLGTMTRADGAELLLERAYLAWARVELVACDGARAAVRELKVGQARAHGGASRTELVRAWVEPLITPEATVLGELAPPSARFCKVVVGAAAATDAAEGVPADLAALVGASLYLEGFFRAGPEAAWAPFVLRETASFDVTVALDHVRVADGAALTIELTKDAGAWFEGVDPTAPGAARVVLERVQGSIAAVVEAAP